MHEAYLNNHEGTTELGGEEIYKNIEEIVILKGYIFTEEALIKKQEESISS